MTTIIAIVGPSGSGKTEMSFFCKKEFGIPYIVSYTTRDKRPEEIDGVDHYFVTPNDRPNVDEMLAYTVYGGKEYWAKLPDKDTRICSYVIDEDGLLNLKEKHSNKFKIIPIYIRREDRGTISKERKQRDLTRHTSIPLKDYFCIIENSGTLEDFHETIRFLIDKIKDEKTFFDYYCSGKFKPANSGIFGVNYEGDSIRVLDLVDANGYTINNQPEIDEITKRLNGDETAKCPSGVYTNFGAFIKRGGENYLFIRGWGILSETYKLPEDEIFKLQDEFAKWVCNKLNKK